MIQKRKVASTYDLIFRTIVDNHLGDVASVLSVIITFFGWLAALWSIRKSRMATEAARQAVLEVKRDLAYFDLITELSAVVSVTEEIKRLHRDKVWTDLPGKYSAVRRSLIAVRKSVPELPDRQKTLLQYGIQHFRSMEDQIEKRLYGKVAPLDVPALNRIVTGVQDNLNEMLFELKKRIGGKEHD